MRHNALVHWLSPEERGKTGLPATLRYVGLSRFPDEESAQHHDMWSVELRFKQPPPESTNGNISEATVQFWVREAPHERLHGGVRFGLFEGNQKVADVDVLD
jgi:hypothetical protein